MKDYSWKEEGLSPEEYAKLRLRTMTALGNPLGGPETHDIKDACSYLAPFFDGLSLTLTDKRCGYAFNFWKADAIIAVAFTILSKEGKFLIAHLVVEASQNDFWREVATSFKIGFHKEEASYFVTEQVKEQTDKGGN